MNINFTFNRGHHGSVEDVVDFGDGVLVTAGFDKTIKIWRNLEKETDNTGEEISAKKRAKREERGQVRTTGKFRSFFRFLIFQTTSILF